MNENADINFLGCFPDLQSVWKHYPAGGCAGDYVDVGGEKIYWNVSRGLWGEPVPVVGEDIYTSGLGSLIVKGKVHLIGVPPVAGNQTVTNRMIVPVYDTVAGKWGFMRATSFGGVESETVTITASVNAGSLSQGYVKWGDRRSDLSTGLLEVTVSKGSDVTFEFIPNTGYEVSNVSIDEAEQGIISYYTFDGVMEDHTISVWYREAVEVPVEYTDFLVRSDLEGVFYSSLHSALTAVKNDYPGGLTRDVEILCIKEGTEYRNPADADKLTGNRIWTAIISDWNKNSGYSLTVNGDNKYTLSAYSLGGVFIKNTDNIIFRNMAFSDYANFSKGSTPEEIAAIYSCGKTDDKNKNIAILGCNFDGRYAGTSGIYHAVYGVDAKLTSNIIIDKCIFIHGGAQVLKLTGTDIIELSRSSVAGELSYSIAHSNLIYASDAYKCLISDCELNGDTFNEYVMQLANMTIIEFRRNHIYNCSGQPLMVSGTGKSMAIFESNIIENCLTAPRYQYCKFIVRSEQSLAKLILRNNTLFMNGTGVYYQECFSVAGDVTELDNYNNIYIDSAGKTNSFVTVSGTLGEYLSGNNLYKAVMHSAGTRFNSVKILSSNIIPAEKDRRSLADLQLLGLEPNTVQLANTAVILDIENGGTDYKLISSLASTYQADALHIPIYDKEYSLNNANATIGAYNINGSQWDETTDTSDGYDGLHIEDSTTFTQDETYTVPADDTLMLGINCTNRNKFVITRVHSRLHSLTLYGRNILLALECQTAGKGIYTADEEYTIEINKI